MGKELLTFPPKKKFKIITANIFKWKTPIYPEPINGKISKGTKYRCGDTL